MKRFILLIGLVGLFVASGASADWIKSCVGTSSGLCTAANVPWDCCTGAGAGVDCDQTNSAGVYISALNGTGRTVCHRYDGATANDDPSILQVSDCDNVDIFYYPDFDGDATDSAGTVDVYTCPSIGNAHLNTEAELEAACQPFNGGTQLTAVNTEVQGLGAGWIWFDVEGWDDDTELQVVCNVGPE